MNAIIIYISRKHDSEDAENELIKLLTDLFDERINGLEKVNKLKSVYGLNMTKEVEREVDDMCTYATAIENRGIDKGVTEGKRKMVEDMFRLGRELIAIADFCHLPLDYILEIQEDLLAGEKKSRIR